MAFPKRPEHHLNLSPVPPPGTSQPHSGSSTAQTSPIEPPSSGSIRYPLTSSNGSSGNASGISRLGAGSPSHEFSGRLYSKRSVSSMLLPSLSLTSPTDTSSSAREIQAQEGLAPQIWCPPTSGHSTPLRETIPESPNGEGFPDFQQPGLEAISSTKSGATRG